MCLTRKGVGTHSLLSLDLAIANLLQIPQKCEVKRVLFEGLVIGWDYQLLK